MQTRPKVHDARDARHQRILMLLGKKAVRRQSELQALLAAAGIPVNQATLSRDLRELGVVKGKDGYELPAAGLPPGAAPSSLWHTVRAFLLSATAAQNLVVLKTPAGGAQALGLALDRATNLVAAAHDGSTLPGVLGTIAGDDTVLAICRDSARARALARNLLQLKDTQAHAAASSA
jgi:transcriptional regulator of arginine metabolism